MVLRKKTQNRYHHGDLAAELLVAVEELTAKFGWEAVSLRACAKALGVSPPAAFKHYADKRALLTAFAAKALERMADHMGARRDAALAAGTPAFLEVGLGYVEFALTHPAMFQIMWRRDAIDQRDEAFQNSRDRMTALLASGFADTLDDDDPTALSSGELLAWSAVHGLASLMVDGPVAQDENLESKLARARDMLISMRF